MGLDLVVGADGALPLPWLSAPLAETLARQRGHALMLHGADGIGALQFGLALAQGWLCEGGGATRPCGRCGSCRLVQARLHPDLTVLLPQALRLSLDWPLVDDKAEGEESKKKPSRQIRIDEVRAMIDWSAKTSARGQGKVAVLHPAERMNAQAASALLKTLEEPPPGTRLLLVVADPGQLLPTVRSRCQRVALAAPPAEQAVAWLADQGVTDAQLLLAAASGRPLRAQELAAAGIDGAAWAALPRAVARGQGGALAGWPVPRAVDALQKLCHDAMAVASGGAPRYFPRASLPQVGSVAPLVVWADALARVARHDEHPWHEPLLLDSLVAQGREALTLMP
jgi:DNA polymerase III subunit delta'